jgi:hypothetical protein
MWFGCQHTPYSTFPGLYQTLLCNLPPRYPFCYHCNIPDLSRIYTRSNVTDYIITVMDPVNTKRPPPTSYNKRTTPIPYHNSTLSPRKHRATPSEHVTTVPLLPQITSGLVFGYTETRDNCDSNQVVTRQRRRDNTLALQVTNSITASVVIFISTKYQIWIWKHYADWSTYIQTHTHSLTNLCNHVLTTARYAGERCMLLYGTIPWRYRCLAAGSRSRCQRCRMKSSKQYIPFRYRSSVPP